MTRDDVIRATASHIRRVGELLTGEIHELGKRAVSHDASKWSEKEWPYFEAGTPKLAGLTYGSDEYRQALRDIKPGVEHHQRTNSHHPEYHANGVAGMDLLDLIEMLCDWKAAGERHNDGSMFKSLMHNRDRFGLGDQLLSILCATALNRGWITEDARNALVGARP